jgi:hypothetical protein
MAENRRNEKEMRERRKGRSVIDDFQLTTETC